MRGVAVSSYILPSVVDKKTCNRSFSSFTLEPNPDPQIHFTNWRPLGSQYIGVSRVRENVGIIIDL
jgi:hypothetical protein